jgi:flagellin-like protein
VRLRSLVADEEAVSPVIGVILVVAITVILAAVVGALALGVGGDQSRTPAATFTWEYDDGGSDTELVVRATGGDRIRPKNAEAVLVMNCPSGDRDWLADESDDNIDAGDTFTVTTGSVGSPPDNECQVGGFSPGETVRLVWQAPQGDTATTLSTYEVPS